MEVTNEIIETDTNNERIKHELLGLGFNGEKKPIPRTIPLETTSEGSS